jgi:hypothetical protein
VYVPRDRGIDEPGIAQGQRHLHEVCTPRARVNVRRSRVRPSGCRSFFV